MIVAIGTDLVDLHRVRGILETRADRFLERILTPQERSYCESRANTAESVGARVAAKEAVMKCLGTGWARGVRWRDIEVTRQETGNPGIRLHGTALQTAESLGIARWHVSLSHTAHHALASVVAEA